MVASKLALWLAAASAVLAGPLAEPAVSKRALSAGTVYTACTKANTIALTFDDGPYAYTEQALNLLDNAGMKGTFFMNGQNWGSIYDYTSIVQRVYNSGHQVGSHTWSHADLATLSAANVASQMTQLENALVSIIGVWSPYLRAPYLSVGGAQSTLQSLGYSIIDINVDTKDYELQDNINAAFNNFVAGLNSGATIALAHDVHANTVSQLLPRMIAEISRRGLKAVTVGECLGEARANWYRAPRNGSPATTTKATPTATAFPESPDWSCGAGIGYRCPGTNCCSQYGWCGSTSEYCGAGCQKSYGKCN